MAKKQVIEFEYAGEMHEFKVPNKRPFEKIKDYGEFVVHAWADSRGIGGFNIHSYAQRRDSNAFSELGEKLSVHRVPGLSKILEVFDPLN